MEQANGFTPTHTEHTIIQPTYQVKKYSLKKKKNDSSQLLTQANQVKLKLSTYKPSQMGWEEWPKL